MKRSLLFVFFVGITVILYGFPKKSLLERYTNSSCSPCASINNSWYNVTTADMIKNGLVNHIVYNVNWPSATDPMYLLNASENAVRWTYYGVNSVPWIAVNGTTVSTTQAAMTNAITTGNAEYSPFKMSITAERFSNKTINVKVTITRDPSDLNSFTKTRLKIGLTEKTVAFPAPLGNGESSFFAITRKMVPDAKGTLLSVPAPGASIDYDFVYVPTNEFLSAVNLDSIRVVAFIQNDSTKMIYQSEMKDLTLSSRLNSAFTIDETLGAAPHTATFKSYSVASDSASLTAYEWDFNNDGTIDSRTANPSWTFTMKQNYSVALTVKDSRGNTHKRVIIDAVKLIDKVTDILVVNGIDYSNATYKPEMTNFYRSAAVYGNRNVDVWDLFGDQDFNFMNNNAKVKQAHYYNRKIPTSVLKLYKKVIWVGNNYSGDNAYFDPAQVIDYVNNGGNFVLATRWASAFFDQALRDYCGVTGVSGDQTIMTALSLDANLVNMSSTSSNSFTHFVTLDTTRGAVKMFDDGPSTEWNAGFRIKKNNNGVFIYIAGRPYRYDTVASVANYNYIIDNYLTGQPLTGIEENAVPQSFSVEQNFPNPFNPSTRITYNLPEAAQVSVRIYDALGQMVKELSFVNMPAGRQSVQVNGESFSSGMYVYTVEATALSNGTVFRQSKKMLLLK